LLGPDSTPSSPKHLVTDDRSPIQFLVQQFQVSCSIRLLVANLFHPDAMDPISTSNTASAIAAATA
ncbi:MAG: hypothetical protein ACKN9U_05705, partial [Pirellulaceae bacterium]